MNNQFDKTDHSSVKTSYLRSKNETQALVSEHEIERERQRESEKEELGKSSRGNEFDRKTLDPPPQSGS